MTTTQTYPIVCHVCGNEFDHESQFMSCGQSRVMPDGSVRLVVTCNIEYPNRHTGDEIRASWLANR